MPGTTGTAPQTLSWENAEPGWEPAGAGLGHRSGSRSALHGTEVGQGLLEPRGRQGVVVFSDAPGRTIVVPLANPASVRPLITIAARLAVRDGGMLIPVTVIRPHAPADERAAAWLGLADAEEVARELEVPATSEVVEHDDTAEGVLELAQRREASLVVMGWRGRSSTSDVFGRLTDTIVGRSSIPLGIVRFGTTPFRRVLLPVDADHLRPGGQRGLMLAATLASQLAAGNTEPLTVVRTGPAPPPLPDVVLELAGEVHHDPRRTDRAMAGWARADHLVVSSVAPTAGGLRAATTHLAWAAPDATLLVAIDVGPTATSAQPPAPSAERTASDEVRIVVTARLGEVSGIETEQLGAVLGAIGQADEVMTWWPADDRRPHVRATVTVHADSINAAIGRLMVAVHEQPGFQGAEITYDVDRGAPCVEVHAGGVEASGVDAELVPVRAARAPRRVHGRARRFGDDIVITGRS